MKASDRCAFAICGLLLLVPMASGLAASPVLLSSQREIQDAPANLARIHMPDLPLKDYPLLSRFTNISRVYFHPNRGDGANDEKLEALASLNFEHLIEVGLVKCPLVTDRGLLALSKIKSLQSLALHGTSVTDGGLETISAKMTLKVVGLAGCTNITVQGLLRLTESDTLEDIGISFDGRTQADVMRLIAAFRRVKTFTIVDPKGAVDDAAVQKAAKAKSVRIVLLAFGPLEAHQGITPRPWSRNR